MDIARLEKVENFLGSIEARIGRLLTRLDSEFNESDHPRASDGKFGSGGGASKAGATQRTERVKLVDGKHVLSNGKPLPPHLEKMKIPPAWTDVSVNMDPKANLWVAGRDSKGRRVGVYSPEFADSQAASKFARVHELSKDFDAIKAKNETARMSNDEKTKAAADCAKLIMKTGVRPGSDSDTGAKVKAYGATTLEGRHVVEEDGEVKLRFTGKKGRGARSACHRPGHRADAFDAGEAIRPRWQVVRRDG